MENDDDWDSGSAVNGGVRDDCSGSGLPCREMDDLCDCDDEVIVGAKLRCCRKSSKEALEAAKDDEDDSDDDNGGREVPVAGDCGDEKGDELLDVEVVLADAAEDGREC